jgi:hypothetical protein
MFEFVSMYSAPDSLVVNVMYSASHVENLWFFKER